MNRITYNNRSTSVAIFSLIATFVLFPSFALAVTADEREISRDLTSQSERFHDAISRREAPAEPTARIIEEPVTPAEPQKNGKTFRVSHVRLAGNQMIPEKEFRPYVEPIENREITVADANAAALAVKNHYRSRGYLTTHAYVPPQKLERGELTIQIVEGTAKNIVVEGNRHFGTKLYQRAFQRESVFNYETFRSDLYFLNSKPDRKATAYLVPGDRLGESTIVLKAEEKNPLHASYEYNNSGTKFTHRGRHVVRVDHNNLTGEDDPLSVIVSGAEEGAFGAVSGVYGRELSRRTAVSLQTTIARTLAVRHVKRNEIKGEYLSFTPEIRHAFVKKPAVLFEAVGAFEFKDSKSLIDDGQTSFDRMRVLRLGPSLTFNDKGGRSIILGNAHWGIPGILGGSDENDVDAGSFQAGGKFLYYTVSMARIQRLPDDMFLIGRLTGQWTTDSLSSVEQFRAGGADTVRGYPESDSAGDSGYNASAEWHIPWNWADEANVPYSKNKIKDSIRTVLFVDAGKTFIRERENATDVKDRLLLGAGAGIRFNLDDNVSIRLDAAWPLGDASADEDSMQIHIECRIGF